MSEQRLPKVLAISLSTWRKDSGIHTQTDLFKFWESEQVAQIYLKSDLPNTPVCTRFFQIAENAIIKSVINRKPVGREVQNFRQSLFTHFLTLSNIFNIKIVISKPNRQYTFATILGRLLLLYSKSHESSLRLFFNATFSLSVTRIYTTSRLL